MVCVHLGDTSPHRQIHQEFGLTPVKTPNPKVNGLHSTVKKRKKVSKATNVLRLVSRTAAPA